MTLFYVIVTIKLCPEVGNGEYVILRNFGGRMMSGVHLIIVDGTEMPFKSSWLKPLSHCQEN